MTTAINNAYINALLADASYVNLSDQDGVLPEGTIKIRLADRLTQPLADFITQNFIVKNQEIKAVRRNNQRALRHIKL